MMITPNLNDGESFVAGRSEHTARALYEAAENAGIDPAKISTTSHGYIVPSSLVSELDSEITEGNVVEVGDLPAVRTEPGTTTNPDEAWNADAWKREQEELANKNVEDGARAIVEPVEENQAKASEADRKLDKEGVGTEAHPEQEPAEAGKEFRPGGIAKTPEETNDEAKTSDFDPAEHTVEEVKEYLETADEKERDRVIAAEEASEKPRRGILKLADEEEGDK